MTNSIQIVNASGAKVGDYALQDLWLEFEKGAQAVHDVVVAYLAGERAGTASTKTRAEVRGGGCKPFRQKGGGRARAGSTRSPIWRKGGVIFGPKPRSFAKKVNKKVRHLALKRAFTESLGKCQIVENIVCDGKVKSSTNFLQGLGATGVSLIVVKEYTEELGRSFDNLSSVLVIKAASVNVYQLLRFNHVIFTKEAMDEFVHRLA